VRANIGDDQWTPVNLNLERRWAFGSCVREVAGNLVGETGDLEPVLKTLAIAFIAVESAAGGLAVPRRWCVESNGACVAE